MRVPLLTALLLVPLMLLGTTHAAFTAATSSFASTFAAASGFPGFTQSIAADGPALYHRQEEALTSSLNGTVADSSGNARPGTNTGATNGPSTVWAFEEGSGTVAADNSGVVNQGTLHGASWQKPGRMGTAAVALDGVDDYVESDVPPLTTTGSYTAMAWVYLTDASQNRYAMGQEGARQSVFGIHAFVSGTGACGCWSVRYVADTDNPTGVRVNSTTAVALNTWVHLATVRDIGAGRVHLYVNGKPEANVAYAATVNATGPLTVGRVKANGAWSNFWKGAVDEVRTYNRVVSAADIKGLYEDAATGHWGMNEAPGATTAADVVGQTATLAGDATFGSGHAGNALQLDGNGDYALTSSVPIDTEQTYTVAAWLYLTDTSIDRNAVAAEGSLQSAFAIQANAAARTWRVRFAAGDVADAASGRLEGTSVPQAGQWTHVAVVRTPTSGQLYINTVKEDEQSLPASWKATAGLSFGRQLNNGGPLGFWRGAVDEVRVYPRALSAVQITRLYKDRDVQTGPGMTGGVPGALRGQAAGSALAFGGWISAYNNTAFADAGNCTVEVWFRAGTGAGGHLVGFSSHPTSPNTGTSDRMLYLDSGGRLSFGVGTGNVRSPVAYDDAQWHHAAASVGPAGLKLYVDGVRVATNPAVTTGPAFTGYWRWGGAQLWGRPNRPANDYFVGTLDEVVVYPTQLGDQQISWHHAAGR
ncbi:LamG domain-containing protein [Couchioplanes caeruleus]|uniref:LamG-like jellyroll fold domain-containing protein n=1 Tax=Couchioplanes caeruleus subsp. caeruleus TaxID=56427 RepID=A0A1K0FN30_9ACTN|nr:LamG domain-containing protein [Couchioplanes caeruleus]OJF14237.1 hypothetical protein BG844_10835 [Couchioplanes caeruleus subsp. caeruleus]